MWTPEACIIWTVFCYELDIFLWNLDINLITKNIIIITGIFWGQIDAIVQLLVLELSILRSLNHLVYDFISFTIRNIKGGIFLYLFD